MHARACVHYHTQYININYLPVHPHHSARYIKEKYQCALVFLRLNLTYQKETRTVVYKVLFGPQFWMFKTVLTPFLTGAVMKGVKVRGRMLWVGHVIVGTGTARVTVMLVKWDRGCSELQEMRKRASLAIFYWLYNNLAIIYQRESVRASGGLAAFGVAIQVSAEYFIAETFVS